MTRLLIAASALALMAGTASAQITVSGAHAHAGVHASAVDSNDWARSRIPNERSNSRADGAAGWADALVRDGIGARAHADAPGGGNYAGAHANQTAFNVNAQFQQGIANEAINMQVGNNNESATVQIGDVNTGLISQDGNANEAALAQVGNFNTGLIAQQGTDHAATIAQSGVGNMGVIAQNGGVDNIAATAQVGNNNTSVALQNGEKNTLASLQEGNNNRSFISQGGGLGYNISAINGTSVGGSLGTSGPAYIHASAAAAAANWNSAANMQLGNNNVSAIVQVGAYNEAINYQMQN